MKRKKALKHLRKALDFCDRNEYLTAKHYERSRKALKFLEGEEVGSCPIEIGAGPRWVEKPVLEGPNELQSLIEWATKDLSMRTEETIKSLIPKELHFSTRECGNFLKQNNLHTITDPDGDLKIYLNDVLLVMLSMPVVEPAPSGFKIIRQTIYSSAGHEHVMRMGNWSKDFTHDPHLADQLRSRADVVRGEASV